jgi:hypothetical protein
MKRRFVFYLLAFSSLMVTNTCIASGPEHVSYGAKVVFTDNAPLQFADFTLTYIGTRRVRTYPPSSFLFYDFKVVQGTESRVVSWRTAGAGEIIGYQTFAVSGTQFILELGFSNSLGKLKENELVITKSPNQGFE